MKEHPYLKDIFVAENGDIFTARFRSGGTKDNPRKLKVRLDKDGYPLVCAANENRKVHRLVAETYIPNPHNKPQVHHKDENKKNHSISNLEWVTNKENSQASFCKYLWTVEHPDGTITQTISLRDFIKTHKISKNLFKTWEGDQFQSSGGWKIIDKKPL